MNHRIHNDLSERLYGASQRIWVYFIGLIIASMIGNLAYEFIHELGDSTQDTNWKPMIFEAIGIVVLWLGVALPLNEWYKRQETQTSPPSLGNLVDRPLLDSSRGLIWMLSPFNFDHAVKVINGHVDGLQNDKKQEKTHGRHGKLEVCWCIMAKVRNLEKQTQDIYNRLNDTAVIKQHGIKLIPIWLDKAEVEDTFDAVNQIYEVEIPKYNQGLDENTPPLKTEEVIADITSGLRSMSAGMLLACLNADRPIEYFYTLYDTQGNPTGNNQLMFIETTQVSREHRNA